MILVLSAFGQPVVTSVDNAASYSTVLAPGSIAAVFGTDLATTTGESGVTVTLGGDVCFNYFVSASQINVELPTQLAPGPYTLTVSHDGMTSAPFAVTLVEYAPGIFDFQDATTGSNLVTASAPARIGDVIVSYGAGLGATTPSVPTGQPAPTPAPTTNVMPTVTVNGVSATVSFSGLTPGLVDEYQVNFTIPEGVPLGAVPVIWSIGGVASSPVNIYIGAGPPASISVNPAWTPGTYQVYTQINPSLAVTVLDSNSNPVTGATVTFTAPSSGASVVFANDTSTSTAVTDTNGNANSGNFFANGIAGPYQVNATVTGVATPATFGLTNTTLGPQPGSGFTLSTAASPSAGGTVTPPSGLYLAPDTIAQLSTTESLGYTFTTWAGAVADPYSTFTTVNMTAAQSVTANFIGQVFNDVAPTAYYFDAVNLLSLQGITAGCGNSDYCPSQDVTRAEMAIFIVRMVIGSDNFTYNLTPYFDDVSPTSFGFKWIQKLDELGITAGCGNNDYCPNETVTRAQMAIFIIRARYGATTAFDYPSTPYFSDVPSTGFGFEWIQRMKFDNITAGCSATDYCPNNPVTRQDMAIFLMRGGFNRLLPLTEPVLFSATPNTIPLGATETITVTGNATDFTQGTISVPSNATLGFTVNSVSAVSPTVFTMSLTATSTAPTYTSQPFSIWVTNTTATGNVEAVFPNAISLVTGP
jgi:uncharacterized protein (TIGR03437 family)